MKPNYKTIAYLAPELPALSATFVTEEIRALEIEGLSIVPISVHKTQMLPLGNFGKNLLRRTQYLYGKGFLSIILSNLKTIFRYPFRYLGTLCMVWSDMRKVGLRTRLSVGIAYRFLVASRLANILRRERCSHLHVHFAHIPTDLAMYASRISGIPFSFTAHANDIFQRGWLLKEKAQRARWVVTISEFNKKHLIKQGAPQDKIHTIHCGVDSSKFREAVLGNRSSLRRIGTLGRFVEKKGIDVLIQSCKKLKAMKVPFHLEIAGSGPWFHKYVCLVSRLGLTGCITFSGPIVHDRVPDWLRKLDLFILPCKQDRHHDMDGIPVVLMEAMQIGIPVISTRLSGIPELIEDGKTGLLAEPGDADRLFLKIICMLRDDSFAHQLARAGQQKARQDFDLFRNVGKLLNLFKGKVPCNRKLEIMS